jgi:oligopeptide transport system substrate-binding protein
MGLVLVACVLLALAGCSKHAPAGGDQILRLSQRNEPASLDPQVASLPDEFFVIRALSEGLVLPIPDGVGQNPVDVVPGAALAWETSPNGLVWTFHLRPDGRWSNGDRVTAGDFVATIRRAINPALAPPKAPLFFGLKNAEAFYRGTLADASQVGAAAPNDRTLVLTLEHPVPELLSLAASGPWLPVHAATVAQFGDNRGSPWTRPGNFVGNGPFVLTEWRPHELISVRRNPFFRGATRVHLDGIDFQVYDDENTEERAFRAGQVDVTMTVPVSKIGSYAPPVLHAQPLAETRFLSLNVRKPPLNDSRVRRALFLAIDRGALVRSVLKGGQQPAETYIPPGLGGYWPALGREGGPAAWDPATVKISPAGRAADEARRLLGEAGFPGGRGFPVLEVSTWTANPVIEAVQQMWRQELGIETTIVRREAKVHVAALRTGDYAIGFLPAIPDYGDASSLFNELVTGAAGNYPQWSNARYDALVAEAGRTMNAGARLSVYQKAEQILLADLPVVPLYFNSQSYLVAPRVGTWRSDRLWNRFYTEVTLHP